MFAGSSSRSQGSYGSSQTVQLNDSVYELHKPAGVPSIQVVFVHGLQLDAAPVAHLSTWTCEDGSSVWPQTWLIEEFPKAHTFSVSLSGVLQSSSDNIDTNVLGQSLISDLLKAFIGLNGPLVLVGHSIGGLVIESLCYQMHEKLLVSDGLDFRFKTFLQNLQGVFYYSTPRQGSPVSRLASMADGPLMKYFQILSKDAARVNSKFDSICKVYKWQSAGLGESLPTILGSFTGIVVNEASGRGSDFNVVKGADHFSISRPGHKTSESFRKLMNFLHDVVLKVNPVCELYKPRGICSLQVVFVHGLQAGSYRDAHLSTWTCEDGSSVWPQTWMVEEFPKAHAFSVSLSGVLEKSSDNIDMYVLGQSLISDLLMANIGLNGPLVLVGHSIGGLVIESLCYQMDQNFLMGRGLDFRFKTFLQNLQGVFYYSTPRQGSPVSRLASMADGPLMKYFQILSKDAARVNSKFDSICKVYKWQSAGLGESLPTILVQK